MSEYRIKVEHDIEPLNPRTDWDNLGTMVCFHSRYNLGDEHDYSSLGEFFVEILDQYGTEEEKRKAFLELWFRDCLTVSDVKDLIKDNNGNVDDMIANTLNDTSFDIEVVASNHIPEAVVVLPLFLYDHSGITMSCSPFSCGWDSGQVGVIYIPIKTVEEQCGKNPNKPEQTLEDRAVEVLESEVDTYDHYLTGQIFCYVIEESKVYTAEDGDTLIEWNVVDSCGGFFDDDDCRQEAEANLRYFVNDFKGESSPTP